MLIAALGNYRFQRLMAGDTVMEKIVEKVFLDVGIFRCRLPDFPLAHWKKEDDGETNLTIAFSIMIAMMLEMFCVSSKA